MQAHGSQVHQLLEQLNAQAALHKELQAQCASQQQLLAQQAAREAAIHQAHLNALQVSSVCPLLIDSKPAVWLSETGSGIHVIYLSPSH